MKQSAPKHIIEYCYRDNDDSAYAYLYEAFGAETSFVYKVKCTCNCERFIVYQDAHPSVFAKCCNCGNTITVYDLKYYPAAVKLNRNYAVNKVDENSVRVYVNYEYNDEFLDEEDDFLKLFVPLIRITDRSYQKKRQSITGKGAG